MNIFGSILTKVERYSSNRLLKPFVNQIQRLGTSRFLRNVAIIAGGTAMAQIITIAFSPIITRLYGPEAFGILGVFLAAVGMISPLSNLTYNVAIVIAPSDAESRALFKLSLLIGIVVTILSALILGSFHEKIAAMIGFNAASSFLFFIPIVILLSAIAEPLGQWLIRKKQFRALSRISIIEAAANGSSKAGVGLIAASAPVLLIVNVIGSFFQPLLFWISARHTLRDRSNQGGSIVRPENPVSLKDVAFKYRDFPLFRAPQAWLNNISQSIPVIMLASLVGPASAGFYSIGRRVLGFPSLLVSGAVGTVFLPRISEASRQSENLQPLILKGTVGLALAGLLPYGAVIACGPSLFSFVFGAKWITAGEYARWLAIWLYFMFINVPSVQAIPLLSLQGHLLIYETFVIALRVSTLAFGALVLKSALASIALFSISGAVVNVGLIGFVLIKSRTRTRKEIRSIVHSKNG